ncbi:hypothetical protein IQ266_22155 [filamentous cyanobacterium LEGE 11480]|uniref:Uncharacterized protein n=1 Tax=Romeriopsis navalis LEGE 11480 TaxID=2777977 RepID=A0A928VQ54_9CYAN|nr:hypothetical protein [Romeriopsis navalis]MBE9032445.1 hypothetical protein [Romeriopsis navalis LEGE 11480]
MKNFAKSAALVAISAVSVATAATPAFAGAEMAVSTNPACRRVISNTAGPEQPRAVAGLNNDQVALYAEPNDIYAGKAVAVKRIGTRLLLDTSRNTLFVRDGQTTGGGVKMIAVRHDGQTLWMPLSDAAADRNGQNIQSFGKTTLGYCSVRGMW